MIENSRKGLTLIEVLFVLGIMAILLGAIFVTYGLVDTRVESNDFQNEVLLILQSADDLVNNQPGVMFNEWQLRSFLPSKYSSSNKENIDNGLISPWRSPVNFWYYQGTDDVYYLAASDIPYAICRQLMHTNWSEFNMTINSVTCTPNEAGYISLARNYKEY